MDKSPVSHVIDHKAFAFDEADGERDFDDALEHVAQKVAVAEVAACQWRPKFPHFRRTKIPQFGGLGDQPAR